MKRKKTSSSSPWQSGDADHAAERTRYAEPIPSRNHILKTLAEQPGPMTLDDLIGHFGLTGLSQQEALAKRLAAMAQDGQLAQNRRGAYGPVGEMNLVAGAVQAHRDGFGFLIPDAGGPDVFLPPRQMRSLMNGDRVLVRIVGRDSRGRAEGALSEVIERASRMMVGRLHVEGGVSYVIPENPRVQQDILVPTEGLMGARHGQMVVAEIVTPPGNRTLPVGRVTEILGDHLAPGMEIEAAIRAHGLPFEWPAAVEAEARAIPDTVQKSQIQGREDIRDMPLVTIDGADARDFDDAVHARAEKKGWTLWVAIADVAAYVTIGSALDKEGARRGNSVYFPQRVIPMLPEKLSNGLCSLNPDVDRLCMVCEMRVMPDGEVASSRFFEGVMRSQARLIYETVAAILEDPRGEDALKRPQVVPHLQTLNDVFEALFAARERRGAIDFETTETRIVFSGERKIDRIVPVKRNRAHRLIEECMVAANVEAAKLIEKHKVPNLYRVHERPDETKVLALREFLATRALSLAGGSTPSAKDFAGALARAKGRPDLGVIQTIMLRSLMQARYSPANIGHYGLALTHYAHFTSPIRRYPDLLLHRGLKHIIRSQPGGGAPAGGRGARAMRYMRDAMSPPRKSAPVEFAYTPQQMEAHGTHCSLTERRADEATRDVTTWLKCEFMRHRIGEELDGTIASVAPFGLFVELDGLYIDGLVHVSSLSNDYYEHDARSYRLVGSRSGTVYGLGDRLRVKVVRVNLDERKIDLELVRKESSSQIKPQGRKSGGQDRQNRSGRPQSNSPKSSKPKSHNPKGKRR